MPKILDILVIGLGLSCLLLADDGVKQTVQVTNTVRADFTPGGILRLKNSVGEVILEGSNRPDVEITTVKTTKAAYYSKDREQGAAVLNEVRIDVERRGNELFIGTDFPRYGLLTPPLRGGPRFDLEYRIKVPRDAQLVVAHDVGNVHVDNVTGSMHVTVHQGEIGLRLPEEGQYDIDARSRLGYVVSDFPGHEIRNFWLIGRGFVRSTSAVSKKLYLRVGFGDIIISKESYSQTASPLTQ